MLLILLAVLPLALGQNRPGFIQGHGVEWRDCGVGATWVSFNNFDITPNPIKLPGDLIVSFDGTIKHTLENSVTLDVVFQKLLLGRWTNVTCNSNVGTCHYTDPCHCLNTFASRGTCPPQMVANGLPCTCPFNPKKLHLPATSITVTGICDAWKFLATGDYYVKITMNDKATTQVRACLESYLSISV